jgi:maestro heat-like repeat-containing protein family member 1
VQRQGCAQGFGYCAATHLDASLERLQDLLRPKMPSVKKQESGGFFSKLFGGSDKPKGPTEGERKTAVLALGYITAYAPAKLITSRLEVSIMSTLNPMLENATSVSLRETLIKAIDLIGKTVHPNHLKLAKGYAFSQRDALLSCLVRYMCPNATSNKRLSTAAHASLRQLRILGLNACSTLVQLEPELSETLETELVKSTVKFFTIQPLLPPGAQKKKLSAEKTAALEEAITAQRTLFENFNQLLATILAMNSSMECLSRLCKVCCCCWLEVGRMVLCFLFLLLTMWRESVCVCVCVCVCVGACRESVRE